MSTPGASWLDGDPRGAGYALLAVQNVLRFQTPWWHLDATTELAVIFSHDDLRQLHRAPFDLRRGTGRLAPCAEAVAQKPNVAIKISGLGRVGLPWTVEANSEIIRDTISIFGVDRCMFASNFPVDSLAGTFDQIYSGFFAAVADRPAAEQRQLFHDNAVRLYRL